MAPPSALVWSVSLPTSSVTGGGWKKFERATNPFFWTSSDHLSPRILGCLRNALSVAASTSKSTSVSVSSESISWHDLKGSSGSLDIVGNVLATFDDIPQRRQEINEGNNLQQPKIFIQVTNSRHLYEIDTYDKNLDSHFDSCLAPLSQQLQEHSLPSTGSQQIVQSLCTNPSIARESFTENQEATVAKAVTDVASLAKSTVEAVLAEDQGLEGAKIHSDVLYTGASHPSSEDHDNIHTKGSVDMLGNSKLSDANLRERSSHLDEQQHPSDTSVNVHNVVVRSNRRMERKAKRDRVSQKTKELNSAIASSEVCQKRKKPVMASDDPTDPISSVLREPESRKLLSASEQAELSKGVQACLRHLNF